MCGRFGTSRCVNAIYRLTERKERHEVTIQNHGNAKP